MLQDGPVDTRLRQLAAPRCSCDKRVSTTRPAFTKNYKKKKRQVRRVTYVMVTIGEHAASCLMGAQCTLGDRCTTTGTGGGDERGSCSDISATVGMPLGADTGLASKVAMPPHGDDVSTLSHALASSIDGEAVAGAGVGVHAVATGAAGDEADGCRTALTSTTASTLGLCCFGLRDFRVNSRLS